MIHCSKTFLHSEYVNSQLKIKSFRQLIQSQFFIWNNDLPFLRSFNISVFFLPLHVRIWIVISVILVFSNDARYALYVNLAFRFLIVFIMSDSPVLLVTTSLLLYAILSLLFSRCYFHPLPHPETIQKPSFLSITDHVSDP